MSNIIQCCCPICSDEFEVNSIMTLEQLEKKGFQFEATPEDFNKIFQLCISCISTYTSLLHY